MIGIVAVRTKWLEVSVLDWRPNDGTRCRNFSSAHALFCAASSSFFVTLVMALSARPAAAQCNYIPAGKSFWVRLLDPIASYSSKPGTLIRAMLIQSPECNASPVFPVGLEVDGEIVNVQRVGFGFKHDTASIKVRFDRLVTATGATLLMASQVVEVDNARESVQHGVIHGIRATDTPQGRITSRLIHIPTFNPYTDWGLIVYRSVFTKLPEPEIYFPPGTDIRLQLNVPLYVADQPDLPRPSLQMDEYERGEVETLLGKASERTKTRYGKDADLVNLLLIGSYEQVDRAFEAAGWLSSDPNSARAFFREFVAFLSLSNYPTMPVSWQLLDGQLQDMARQKSLDSYGKREHLRLWQKGTVEGQQAWLGAYTRETSAALSVKYHKFVHHVDPNLDQGVLMLVRDLSLAGCVESVRQLQRPELAHNLVNATGDDMHTDGVLNVVHLKDCEHPLVAYAPQYPLVPIHPHSKIARYLRTQVLVYKSDVIRGNLVYSAFDLARMGFRSLRHQRNRGENPDDLPQAPVSPDTLLPTSGLAVDRSTQRSRAAAQFRF
jgi:hypothetical protein